MSKRQVVLSETLAKAKYLVRATLRNNAGAKVSGILCGVFLPQRLADPIKLHFQPTRKQMLGVNFARFSAQSTALSFSATTRHGGRRIKFSAKQIWYSNTSEGHHNGIPFVSEFTAEPTDFPRHSIRLGRGDSPGWHFLSYAKCAHKYCHDCYAFLHGQRKGAPNLPTTILAP